VPRFHPTRLQTSWDHFFIDKWTLTTDEDDGDDVNDNPTTQQSTIGKGGGRGGFEVEDACGRLTDSVVTAPAKRRRGDKGETM